MKYTKIKISLLLTILTFPFGQASLKAQTTQIEKPFPYIVNIKAIDYAFQMPKEIKSGWVTFKFENMGHEMHFAQMYKFPDNVTEEGVLKFMANPSNEIFEKYIKGDITLIGGPGFHAPGQQSQYTIQIEPGTYGIVCNTRTKEGVPHADLGMYKYFKVTNEDSGAERPVADLKLSLEKYVIKADGQLQKGRQTVEVTHMGGDRFDMHLAKLNDTSTIAATLKFFDHLMEPSQTLFEGGAEQKKVDKKSYVTVDFEPGDHAFLSHEYSAIGMFKKFTIPENGNIVFNDNPAERKAVEVKVIDNSIEVPHTLSAGPKQFNLSTKDDSHFVQIFRLEPGETIQDYLKFKKEEYEMYKAHKEFSKENPTLGYYANFKDSKKIRLNLRPGTYGITCFQTDEDDKFDHMRNGEVQQIIVK
ncbi:hypothetical protein C7S20_03555 [Christiangramia fulva]|uniref:Uncharacterized protein n=1 Tax=Christiangramia fulva TaxID=2126553 RepID=A0A2R3Z2D2_9FLAO|nr:hypothetical protein [Christiangramia fulva]AVR44406.1 hypothetical protein C7S20_03555 [Christiangramia fulva]